MIYLFLAWSWITFTFLLTMCYWAYCWRVWKQVEVLYLNAITNFTSWSSQLHKNMFSLKAPLWFMFMMILIRQNSWWKTTLVREHPSFQIMILKISLKKRSFYASPWPRFTHMFDIITVVLEEQFHFILSLQVTLAIYQGHSGSRQSNLLRYIISQYDLSSYLINIKH